MDRLMQTIALSGQHKKHHKRRTMSINGAGGKDIVLRIIDERLNRHF
jgi:hypothetical protein